MHITTLSGTYNIENLQYQELTISGTYNIGNLQYRELTITIWAPPQDKAVPADMTQ
jgi:hypothetical protein